MIKLDKLFNNYTLNIFTDASVKNLGKEYITCSGSACVIGENIINTNTRITRHSTSNLGEALGVLLGIEDALKYKNNVNVINLFSDSKITIFAIREWIFSWMKRSSNNILYTSKGKEVANQEVILTIINTILANNLIINFYHQNGHIDINNMDQLNEARNTFINFNEITHILDMNIIKTISYYNNYIDNYTRDMFKNIDLYNYPELRSAIKVVYKPFNIEQYKNLININ